MKNRRQEWRAGTVPGVIPLHVSAVILWSESWCQVTSLALACVVWAAGCAKPPPAPAPAPPGPKPPSVGDEVIRGPDWNKGSADGPPGARGVIVSATDEDAVARDARGYVLVEWLKTGRRTKCRWDVNGLFDVKHVPQPVGPKNTMREMLGPPPLQRK